MERIISHEHKEPQSWHPTENRRAEEHIRNLDIAIRDFLADKPYRLAAKRHPVAEIEHATLYVAEVKPVPDVISLIVGDAIHNLRSALDHLMWALYLRHNRRDSDSSLRSE